jgi:hypothetical protein
MSGTVPTLLAACLIILGAALVYWSAEFSVRYNTWTTRFREKHPRINPPPTPQMRDLNTRIMTWLLRLVGACFVLLSVLVLIKDWR